MIRNFIAWAKAVPGNHHYTHLPKNKEGNEKPRKHFSLKRLPSTFVSKAKKGSVSLFASILPLFPRIIENLKIINDGKEPTSPELENFARFMMQMGGEHVNGYSNDGKLGIVIPKPLAHFLAETIHKKAHPIACLVIVLGLVSQFIARVAAGLQHRAQPSPPHIGKTQFAKLLEQLSGHHRADLEDLLDQLTARI
jgi:hypothetical protein